MLPVFRTLAQGKRLRGTLLDIFGYTADLRLERQIIAAFEAMMSEVERRLSPETHRTAVALAALPEEIRGFGHIKHANYEKAVKKRETLVAMLRDPKPASTLKAAE